MLARRAHRAELELVAGEGERRGAVAVARVARELRQRAWRPGRARRPGSCASAAPFSSCSRMSVSMSPRKIEMIAGGASLAPSRWSLPAEATEARSRSACRSTARMTAHEEHQELHVRVRLVLRVEQVDAGVGGHRPVVVLARAVDAGERLLVQERLQAVARRDALERLHDEHLVVAGDVGRSRRAARSRTGPARPRCAGS